ncbi:MAG: hypothetical protein WD834_00325 [Actinomycetota bacterium]
MMLLLAVLSGSCSDADSPGSGAGDPGAGGDGSASQEIGRFVLSGSGCRYEGPETVDAGEISLSIASEMGAAADFDLWQMEEGHTYSELVAHIDEEQRRFEAGEPGLGPPTFATLVAQGRADPSEEATITIEAAAGEYGMACIGIDPDQGTPASISAAGPFVAG